jgi:hypothetical protein
VGTYQKGGVTEISVLHPRYLHPATDAANAVAEPSLTEMLDAVTK